MWRNAPARRGKGFRLLSGKGEGVEQDVSASLPLVSMLSLVQDPVPVAVVWYAPFGKFLGSSVPSGCF